MATLKQTLAKNWDELVKELPDDLEVSAKHYGALQRRREVESAADLLRLILIYATVGSLRLTVIWGVCLKICDISRQDFQRRVHRSAAWLHHLLTKLLQTTFEPPQLEASMVKRLILRDVSTISRPSSPGTEWRLHLSWYPFLMQPASVTLTDDSSREGLETCDVRAGDLIIADRAYGIRRTIQIALDALAYFVIRLTWSNLPLSTLAGEGFDLPAWLRQIPETTTQREVHVVVRDDSRQRPVRLVAGRLPPDKAEEAREKVRRQARKEHREPHPNTLLAAGFCLVLTNLPSTVWSTSLVLACYRIRWQIEWCFRRWKSLCDLDVLPAYPAAIAEIVLLAKLIIIILMQKRLGLLPWQEWWAAPEPVPAVSPVVTIIYHRLCDIIRPFDVLDQVLEDPQSFLRHLRSSHRKRPLQLAEAAQRFAKLLPNSIPVPP